MVFSDAGPGNLKHRSHAYPGCPAVQGIAAGGGQQNGIHAQRCRRSEDGAHIGGIHDTLQYGHPAGLCTHLFHRRQGRPLHGTQYATVQAVTGEIFQQMAVGGIDRQIAQPVDQILGLPVDVFAFGQKRDRLIAGVQRPADDLGAFRHKQALFGLGADAQLCLGKPGKYIQRRGGKIGDFDNIGHKRPPETMSDVIIQPEGAGVKPQE